MFRNLGYGPPSTKHLNTIKIVSPAHEYAPAGKCIYCGRTVGRLTIEHIIPQSLGGNLLLPKATCGSCSKITEGFETAVSRNFFWPIRTQMRFPSKKRKWPKTFKIYVRTSDGGELSHDVPLALFPVEIYLYKFAPCGLLAGRLESEASNFEAKEWRWGPSPEDIERVLRPRYGGVAVNISRFHPWPFFRMLAKIGHSYAVAECGADSFAPLLLPIILDRPHALISHYVGGSFDRMAEHHEDLHRISLEEREIKGRYYLIAQLDFFSLFGGAHYHVVVGELSETQRKQIPVSAQVPHARSIKVALEPRR
jgi:hypothetical protein